MIYPFFKNTFKVVFRLYFKEHIVVDKHLFNQKGPIILVSNHPNTLVDVVGVAKELNHNLYFLGNSGLFASKFTNWFFTQLYGIPIERPRDVSGRKIDNTESFKKINDHFNNGDSLYIAAEGTSTMERLKHKFKTGAARMALNASAENDFKKTVRILPVSVVYNRPNYFRSKILIIPSEPIDCLEYANEYTEDNQGTVKKLTQRIQETIYDKSIYFDEEEDLVEFKNWEYIYRAENDNTFKEETLDLIKVRDLIQDNEVAEQDKMALNAIHSKLKEHNLTYKSFVLGRSKLKDYVFLILMFPVFVLGLMVNLVPSGLTIFIVRLMKLYPGYNSTAKMALGWFITPIYYMVIFFCFRHLIHTPLDWLLILAALPLGLFAFDYYTRLRTFVQQVRIKGYLNKHPEYADELSKLRTDVVFKLNNLITK